MGENLQESADCFKLTNEIHNIKGNIYFVKCLFCKNFIWLMIISSPEHFTCEMGQAQGTNNTPWPPSDIRKERCSAYEVSFMTKY